MIVEFNVGNFRSIKSIQTLSLAAAPIVSKNKELDKENVFDSGNGIELLKSIVIYGGNASGKSNLVKAFLRMLHFIKDSFSNEKAIDKLSDPFILDKTSINRPTFFQLVFILDNKNYRYGF